jgi:hypothetical protein
MCQANLLTRREVAVRVLPMTVRDAVSQFPLAREVPDYAYLMTGEGPGGRGR